MLYYIQFYLDSYVSEVEGLNRKFNLQQIVDWNSSNFDLAYSMISVIDFIEKN